MPLEPKRIEPNNLFGYVRVLALLAALGVCAPDPAFADHSNPRRWEPTIGVVTEVVVIDRTGNASWHAATQKAVQSWNAAHTNLRLTWSAGDGECLPEDHTINVCVGDANGYHGLAWYWYTNDGYLTGATVTFDAAKTAGYSTFSRNALACHEIGHNLVVDHTSDTGSCLGPNFREVPNAHDNEALRATYGTWDAPVTTTTTAPKRCRPRRCRR